MTILEEPALVRPYLLALERLREHGVVDAATDAAARLAGGA